MSGTLSRRDALKLLATTPLVGLGVRPHGAQPTASSPARLQVGLVSRHLQWTTLEDAIDLARQIGFDAIEWNVRTGGHIEPAQVERDLPRAVELTRKAGLAVTMITTAIQDAKSPHAEAILRVMKSLGIRYYRGGQYFRYDYARDLKQQLDDLKPRVASIAALNDKYGTTIAYHTHSGAGLIGGNIWDFWEVIKGFEPRLVGLNYDIGHATARGGAGWIDGASVVSDYISALAIKDVKWDRAADGRWRAEFVPLGEGMIDLKRLFTLLKASGFSGPVNIHYEHNDLLGTDLGKWKLDMSRERFIEIVRHDLNQVKARMQEAG
jgi:sugar phosphate isomerase/epimerase